MLSASHDEGAVPSSGAASSLGRKGVIPSASHDEGAVPSSGIALSLGAALRGGAASLGVTLRGGAALSGATLSLGCRGAILSASHDGGTVPSSGVALCKCMMPPSSHDEGAVLSLGWGASVSCGSARVLALHARGAVVGVAVGAVAVVLGVAVGAVAGVAKSAGWGSRGSSFRVESSLAPLAES